MNQNGFRDYLPTFGRYIESDLIGLDGGINTYGYVRQNPLKSKDFLGLLDINLYPANEDIKKAEDLYNPKNMFSVGGHGNSQFIQDGRTKELLTPEKLSAHIKENPKYQTGETVILHSCNTGSGQNSFAQQLADKLGTTVIAPEDIFQSYWSYDLNDPQKTPRTESSSGQFISFMPRQQNPSAPIN